MQWPLVVRRWINGECIWWEGSTLVGRHFLYFLKSPVRSIMITDFFLHYQTLKSSGVLVLVYRNHDISMNIKVVHIYFQENIGVTFNGLCLVHTEINIYYINGFFLLNTFTNHFTEHFTKKRIQIIQKKNRKMTISHMECWSIRSHQYL